MTVTCRYIYRLTAALLLCSSCALAANTPQTQNATPEAPGSQISTAEQVATIEEFYAKRLVGLEPIRAIFPAAWLTETPAWNEEKNKLQQHLAALSQADTTNTSPHELELTQLKLMWVLFTPAERSDLINSAKTQLDRKSVV